MRLLRENIRNVLNGNGGNIEDVSENAERDAENAEISAMFPATTV